MKIFASHVLGNSCFLLSGVFPGQLCLDSPAFQAVWDLHPDKYHIIKIAGRSVRTPRWQQAYGMDYYYTGQTNSALPIPSLLNPVLACAKKNIDERLNGILVNWYDGALGHYIGRHRDSTVNLIRGVPIVTISFGEDRIFRLRPYRGTGHRDFLARNGTVLIMPYETNLAWTHEVPRRKAQNGRRISVTLRGFLAE